MEDFKCSYCGKICKNSMSLKQHEIRCSKNPNRILNNSKKGTIPWNKGKTKETDPRIKKYAETHKQHFKEGLISAYWTGKTKETSKEMQDLSSKSSKTISSKVKEGQWHNSFSKSKTIIYNGVKLYGTWEVKFAKFLDNHNIVWGRPNNRFEYKFKEKVHYYTPDFYLPEYDHYIEIKGCPTEKDFSKWKNFPEKLDIYFGDDLLKMGFDIEVKTKLLEKIDPLYRIKHIILPGSSEAEQVTVE